MEQKKLFNRYRKDLKISSLVKKIISIKEEQEKNQNIFGVATDIISNLN
jgi:hypothetical protein